MLEKRVEALSARVAINPKEDRARPAIRLRAAVLAMAQTMFSATMKVAAAVGTVVDREVLPTLLAVVGRRTMTVWTGTQRPYLG